MKKNILAAAALCAVICLPGCGADINITPAPAAAVVTATNGTDVSAVTETSEITVIAVQDTTAAVTELQTSAVTVMTVPAETATGIWKYPTYSIP